MKLFSLDSPLMQALNKVADLLWLNVLTLLCCLPVVTIGASLTAMNYMALKMARNEECYITRGFFKSFRENFKQATIIWLIFLVVIVVLAADFIIMGSGTESGLAKVLWGVIMAVAFLVAATFLYVFPVLAKFDNTVFRTVKNALMMSLMQFPKTIIMLVAYVAPSVLFFLLPQAMPLCIMFGLSAPAWISAKLYNKLFKRLEERVLAANPPAESEGGPEDDERIFKDELDPALADKDIT
ncbi:MAG: DUF624 domain-containing protein [Butyrivibrio sp.]|nr:DUF624 domain-containing protein [Acetatifactor muris]MCM1560386.1 DUF624 domain-containing protein [Butyrivibrio sp.]